MASFEKKVELYVIFIDGFQSVEVEVFYDKPNLLRYIRSKLDNTQWEEIILPMLIRDLDAGINAINIFTLSGNRRMFFKKVTTRVGIEKWKNSIVESFLEGYYKRDFAKI